MIDIKTFLIVDGHSLAHRAFHAISQNLTAPDGTPTGMIMAFMNMLYKVQDEIHPDCSVMVFDAKGRTFRHEFSSDYKAGRTLAPDDLRIQLPLLQELLSYCGYRVVIREGVEADDVAASIARLVQREGHEAVVLSSDKDLFQILGERIRMMRPIKNGISGAEIYDRDSFVKEFGFQPESMADYLAITGDSSDNIKGVKGIGDVGAKKLLVTYQNLEGIYSSLPKLSNATRTKFEAEGRDTIIERRDRLIVLRDNLFDDDPDFLAECLNTQFDFDKAEELAVRLGLTRVLRRIGSKKAPLPRGFNVQEISSVPKAEVITINYKDELRASPERFANSPSVWDLKTAYYLLHPDEAARKFPDIVSSLKNSQEKLMSLAGNLNAEIQSYDGLQDVMMKIDLPVIPVLNKMEDHGIRIDRKIFKSLQNELEEKIFELEGRVFEITGAKVNMNSSAQVSWLLFERMGFTPPEGIKKLRAGKSYSTDAAVLDKLVRENSNAAKVPSLILEYRELSKMLSAFVIPFQKLADKDGIIHTTFEPALTGTGRLSSRDPNMQNIPAFGQWAMKLKSGLVPVTPGNVFVSADYSQVELRVLAYMSGEQRLIESFEAGRDIHSQTASWIFGVIPELVTGEMRRWAKVINFGLLYGMSAFGLADRLGVSRHEARDIMTRYFDALPGIQEFLDRLVEESKAKGFSRTLWGRIRPVRGIPSKSSGLERALINSPIQGTAADIARRALIEFDALGKAELFLQVHDSLVCECPSDSADEISNELCAAMKRAGGSITLLQAEAKTGYSLADV